jgi:hypothetical protein
MPKEEGTVLLLLLHTNTVRGYAGECGRLFWYVLNFVNTLQPIAYVYIKYVQVTT